MIKINSYAYYKDFHHEPDRMIYAGDIEIFFENGLIMLEQKAMGGVNRIAFSGEIKVLNNLIRGIEKIWGENIE